MSNPCKLSNKSGMDTWCERHQRFHNGKHSGYALGTDNTSISMREKWDKLHNEKSLPSLITRTGNYLTSTLRHALSGFQTAPTHVQQLRQAHCSTCDANVNGMCTDCGCPTKKTILGDKLARATESCRRKKWDAWKPGISDFWQEVIRKDLVDDGWPADWHLLPEFQEAFRVVLKEKLSATHESFPGAPHKQGILILGGGHRYGIGAYVSARMARHLGWTGPIQLWHRGNDEPVDREVFQDYGVDVVDAYRFRQQHPCRRWGMDKWGHPDNAWLSWGLKSYAALHCPFEQVLYLDADAYLVQHPCQLFANNPTGAVIWYDLAGMAHNLKWDVYGVNPDNRRGWQGGQWLIDKSRCWRAIHLYRWLDDWSDYTYRFGYGDQDNLRLAFQASGTPHHVYTYKQEAVACQPKFGCLRAWGPVEGTYCIHHRITDKEFQRNFWVESGYGGTVLSKRNRWPYEDLVHEFAKDYREKTQRGIPRSI